MTQGHPPNHNLHWPSDAKLGLEAFEFTRARFWVRAFWVFFAGSLGSRVPAWIGSPILPRSGSLRSCSFETDAEIFMFGFANILLLISTTVILDDVYWALEYHTFILFS